MNASARGVTVIVPAWNAAPELADCLDSLERTLPANVAVLVADDASPHPAVAAVAERFCKRRKGARYVRREQNLGFIGNVNRAFAETAPDDVVLLNSDTIATTGWLERLVAAARDPRVATATPWSNNAEICSFPQFCVPNPVPDDPDLVAAAAAAVPPEYPELPTGVGFCMLVTRAALDALGDFDAATFGRGYGEENDFCLRAAGHGWRNVLVDDAYVVHRGGASFGPAGLAPGGDNLRRLNARYPGYNALVAGFILADPLRALRQQLAERLDALTRPGPQRDLFDATR